MKGRKTPEWPVRHLYKGERLSVSDLARQFSLSPQVVRRRIDLGWPEERWGQKPMTNSEAARVGAQARLAKATAKGQCWIGGCESPAICRGLCSKHYQQDVKLTRRRTAK